MSILSQISNPNKSISDEEVVVHDFERRTPFWGHRPKKYTLDERFMEFRNEIDEHLQRLFEGDIDSANGDTLDNLIMDVAKQAEHSLANQREWHKDWIKSLDDRARCDKKAYEEQLVLCKRELEKTEKALKRYEMAMKDNEEVQI